MQFYVEKSHVKDDDSYFLSCHMYQRSCDVFLGLPWNILSYSVLTYILAKRCNMVPHELIVSIGDAHLYLNHIKQINQQLSNNDLTAPKLEVSDSVITKNYNEITIDDFNVIGYFSHKSIKGKMSV